MGSKLFPDRTIPQSSVVFCLKSKSTILTLKPDLEHSTAKARDNVLLPTPPFWEIKDMIFLNILSFLTSFYEEQ
jgi:hypothetical protein